MGNQLFLHTQKTLPIYFCVKILLHGRVLPGEGVQGPPKVRSHQCQEHLHAPRPEAASPGCSLPSIHVPKSAAGGPRDLPRGTRSYSYPGKALPAARTINLQEIGGALGSPQTFPEILLAFPCCLRPRGCWPLFAGNTPGGQREETGGALQPNPHSSLLLPSAGCGGGGMEACPAFGERTKGGEKRRAAAIPRAARGGRRGGRIHSSPAGPCAGG